MKIVEALKQHHDEIRELFSKTESDARLFDKLKKSLEVHHTNEEKYFLESSKEQSETKNESLEAFEEHHAIVYLLEDLDNFPKNDERWKIKLKVLKELVDHHFEEEEEELFDQAAEKMDDEELEKLGEKYLKVKKEQMEVL